MLQSQKKITTQKHETETIKNFAIGLICILKALSFNKFVAVSEKTYAVIHCGSIALGYCEHGHVLFQS